MVIPKKMTFYSLKDLDNVPRLQKLSREARFNLKIVSHILPFRTNNYVVDELINWDNIPDDPIYQLTFLHKDMITDDQFTLMADAVAEGNKDEIKKTANGIRLQLNPQPAGQMINIPRINGKSVPGVQHKYKETALIFPSSGQTCHAYCSFCFRWAQFVGMEDLKFATDESGRFQQYLKNHKEITNVLLSGGDPMIMSLKNLEAYILPLLEPGFEHIHTVRIGTKSVAYWPYKYITDKDADGFLRLFEKVIKSGKHLAIMGHYNHWIELSTPAAKEAVRRIRNTGAEIRSQSPLIKHINDDAGVWSRMWKTQVSLGIIPYYFFIERNTGAKNYFEVPLAKAFDIYRKAYMNVSGLARTVRGPSMSALPGKVVIEGIATINGEKVFALNFIQARNPAWVKKIFFAKYNTKATWLTDLSPAFGEEKFFYQDELNKIVKTRNGQFYFGEDSGLNPYEEYLVA